MNKPLTINAAVGVGLIAALMVIAFAFPTLTKADDSCVFTKDLSKGAIGDDVRCLQKYLNSKGFLVSASGVGSPGQETNIFRDGTEAAVKKWQQANGVSPASGYFGTLSRTKYYDELIGPILSGSPTTVITTPSTPVITTPTVTPQETEARNRISSARKEIKNVKDDINEAEDDGDDTGNAEDEIDSAEDFLIDALFAFFDKDYAEALEFAADALSAARDAADEIEGDGSDGLTLAEAIIFNNETVVKVEFDGDDYVFTTDETDEDDIVDEIMDKVDDEDLRKSDVQRQLEVSEEDRDSRSSDKKISSADEDEEAQEAIDEAAEAIEDAEEEIEEAEDDDRDTDEAEELLEEAEELLDDAEDAFDDEDYEEALDLAEEAAELADDAIDAIED